MIVLVSGATGYLGASLVDGFLRAPEMRVVALGRSAERLARLDEPPPDHLGRAPAGATASSGPPDLEHQAEGAPHPGTVPLVAHHETDSGDDGRQPFPRHPQASAAAARVDHRHLEPPRERGGVGRERERDARRASGAARLRTE